MLIGDRARGRLERSAARAARDDSRRDRRRRRACGCVVADDGAGFDDSAVEASIQRGTGFGIASMRERARALGGDVQRQLPARARHGGRGRLAVTPIRVLLADDHEPTRDDVRQAIEQDPGLEVCAEAADAAGGGRGGPPRAAGRLPARRAHAGQRRRRGLGDLGALPPDADRDADDLDRRGRPLRRAARRRGRLPAQGHRPARIPSAIKDAVEGRAAVPRALTARLLEEFRDTAPRWRSVSALNGPSRLTSREWEIVALLRRGLSTRQIARRLLLSPATVRSHIAAAVRKLGATDRDDLIQRLDQEAGPGRGRAAES